MRHAATAQKGSAPRIFAALLLFVAAFAGFEFYTHRESQRGHAPPAPATAVAPAKNLGVPIGAIDAPVAEGVVGPRVTISGWTLDSAGVRGVEIRVDGKAFPARIGIARPDVAAQMPGFPGNPNSGFEFTGDFSPHPAAAGVDRRELTVVSIATDGREAVLGTRSLIEPSALTRWRAFAPKPGAAFFLLPATSGIDLGGIEELDTAYAPYLSATTRIGFRVPTLYLRMTRGAAADYAFDPAWDPTHKCGARRIGDDALDTVTSQSVARSLPILVTLNGGIWADASCDVPQWDVNDRLEQDPANCQWNQNNEVMPDDYLKNLPGSQDAPELARSLTFNVYAARVRHYKKRNLQQAGRLLAKFARDHPDLFVGVNLDPDTYMNPFFAEKQWYDYNPGTLRQFREWLASSGPYAGRPAPGVPDLRRYRRATPLTLAQVNAIAGRQWRTWDEVDAPRKFPRDTADGARPYWQDPWVHEWENFRRHVVHLHYDELAQWLVEAGISRDRIWSSQGLMAPTGDAMPFAVALDSPTRNYDSGGMSIAGSKPELGHLGVILYGNAALNDVRMDNGASLFATLAAIDPQWAIVEFNTADLRDPKVQPSYAAAYRSLRDVWNFGARFVSPMAWNGSNGVNAGQPGYSTFTAWRNTPLESAARDFLVERAGLPLGSLLWTFGTARHADDDGWTADLGAIALGKGYLTLKPDDNGRVTLLSPAGLPRSARDGETIVLGVPADAGLRRVRVQARRAQDAGWETIADVSGTSPRVTEAGLALTRIAAKRDAPVDQLRVEFTFRTDTPRKLTRIALIPQPVQ